MLTVMTAVHRISGADLLYWRRKAEQWRSIAENAPDDATADYLHTVFEPTAKAIKGLEQALAALGILDEALTLDLRGPQDYFHRTWSTAFRARDLAARCRHPARMPQGSHEYAPAPTRPSGPAATPRRRCSQRLQAALAAAARDHMPVTVAALARTSHASHVPSSIKTSRPEP
ncbi:hypothetical protein QQY24_00135 [Streptomyces sp. TG1A-8]|uniref:hypothetical protein n=1 Tax=Streptomyces sp. TG1A-8 TaxID=3051385 RepID=UPI00265BBADD|nr:hypothetical protein [Streptomyces sp. TG1A-8]MDO0923940.1 hypothetical protein [Streptomyces sp. TG1A-8]